MKIQYFSGEAWEKAFVRERLPSDQIEFHTESLASLPELADPEAEVLCTFIDSPIGEDELARFPKVKLIATRSTGFDHVDVAAATARGIVVANVPYYGEHTVAEFAFALLLALSRKVIDADERVRATGTFSHDNLRGFDLAGKTIGIVGCGHIGIHAIRMANGFSMKVFGFDVQQDAEKAKELNFTYASLNDLLATSDIISIHVPYNEHTHHLINQQNISKCKKGSYLINTARGAVVETDAIVAALKAGLLAGAALDVLEEEGALTEHAAPHQKPEELKIALENHYLIDHPRVIVTPHVAFNTQEAVERILTTSIENIKSFSAGKPANIVSVK